MDTVKLVALKNTIETLLSLDDVTRSVLVGLIAASEPEPVRKGNGLDYEPLAAIEVPRRDPDRPQPRSKVKGKPKRARPTPEEVRNAEEKLLAALRDQPGAKTTALAHHLDANLSTIVERLRRLERRGAVSRDDAGRWRVAQGAPANPTSRPAA